MEEVDYWEFLIIFAAIASVAANKKNSLQWKMNENLEQQDSSDLLFFPFSVRNMQLLEKVVEIVYIFHSRGNTTEVLENN